MIKWIVLCGIVKIVTDYIFFSQRGAVSYIALLLQWLVCVKVLSLLIKSFIPFIIAAFFATICGFIAICVVRGLSGDKKRENVDV